MTLKTITGWLTAVALAAIACTAPPPGRSAAFRLAPGSPLDVVNAGPPVLVDFDADGNMDIVVPASRKSDPPERELVVFFGDGRGRFRPVRTAIGALGSGIRIAVADVNNDDRLDAVVTEHDRNSARLLLSDRRGQLRLRPELTLSLTDGAKPHTHGLATNDLNADGNIDVVATCADENAVAVLLGNGAGSFTSARGSPFPAGEHPYEGLSSGDLNGDGPIDIVVPNLLGGTVSVLLGDNRGSLALAPGSPHPVGARPGFTALGHVNGDRFLDVVTTHDDQPVVTILLGDASGGLRQAPHSPRSIAQPAWAVAIHDVDRDGHADLVLGGCEDRVLVLFGDGTGAFPEPAAGLATKPGSPGYVSMGDLNHDGKPDLVVGHFDGVVSVFLAE